MYCNKIINKREDIIHIKYSYFLEKYYDNTIDTIDICVLYRSAFLWRYKMNKLLMTASNIYRTNMQVFIEM